ncbi:MAG TPA: tetratricopeptide repeat protein [Candidatus Acidoferrum sp.]
MAISTPLDKFARLAALKPACKVAPRDTTLRPTDDTDLVGRLLGAGVARNDFGEHLAIRNWYSTPEFCQPSESALDLLSRVTGPAASKAAHSAGRLFPHYRDESAALRTRAALENPEKWLFLDTETTGLSGGTGTYAFLVGLAWWDAGGLQVEQLFLRDFSEEISLLYELSLRIAERPVLITFNGKTFDWPLLQSRFTMTRKIAVPKLAAHLDLLHPARALWKLRLNSVRLVELERHVLNPDRLGWHREDDIASSQIPQFYFDYLRGGRPDPLTGVAKHNAMDLRGLAALYGKIDGLLDERENNLTGTSPLDLFGLSRFMNRRGEKHRAHSLCTRALDAGLTSTFRRQATTELAMMSKNRGDWAAAVSLWKELACNPRDGIAACEQLAMYYERRGKDCAQALEYANLGLAKAGQAKWLCREPFAAGRMEQWEQKFRRRLERLRNRMNLRKSAGRLPLPDSTRATGSPER